MTPHDPTSLDPEERELAQRLARLGPHGEPSPALDSRVLAAAHAAVSGHRENKGRPARRRWPLGLGVAASLALALGLAWQLRPLPDVAPAYRSEAESALRTSPAAAGAASTRDAGATVPAPSAEAAVTDNAQRATAVADTQQPANRAASAKTIAEPKTQATQIPAPTAAAAPAPPPPPAPAAPQEPPIVFDAPAATQAMPAAPGKATQPPASRAMDAGTVPAASSAPQAFGSNQATETGNAPAPSAERAMAPAAASMPSEPARRKAATPAAVPAASPASSAASVIDEDMPIDDIPPATVASPQVRDAWLARIRELVAAGKLEDARASLHEFQHRYPDYPLPQDLRALLP